MRKHYSVDAFLPKVAFPAGKSLKVQPRIHEYSVFLGCKRGPWGDGEGGGGGEGERWGLARDPFNTSDLSRLHTFLLSQN